MPQKLNACGAGQAFQAHPFSAQQEGTTLTRTAAIRPVEELLWFFHESASDLGHRAIDYTSTCGQRLPTDALAASLLDGWVSFPTPSRRAQVAARRQRRVMAALTMLPMGERRLLALAYEQRNASGYANGPVLESHFGIAWNIVRREQAARAPAERDARARVSAATRAVKAARNHGDRSSAEARARAAMAALDQLTLSTRALVEARVYALGLAQEHFLLALAHVRDLESVRSAVGTAALARSADDWLRRVAP